MGPNHVVRPLNQSLDEPCVILELLFTFSEFTPIFVDHFLIKWRVFIVAIESYILFY